MENFKPGWDFKENYIVLVNLNCVNLEFGIFNNYIID